MPGKLTKAELSREVARVCESSLKESRRLLEIVLDAMVGALNRGDCVQVRGFGRFSTTHRRARITRNPKTGARVEVPAKRVLHFRPAKSLQRMINA
ncbi:MAG: HU family DNA-binding protein [Bryobacteraceae bacterium]